jgi:nitrate reductase (NAD(P)H)
LIKLYLPNESYKEGGKMSLCFNELVLGDLVEFKGPLGSFVWKGRGVCEWRGVERRVTKLGMICAGSGITPILQVLRGIYESDDADEEKPECWVIDSNRKEEDIRESARSLVMKTNLTRLTMNASSVCRDTLNTLSSLSSKLKVHHSLSVPPSSWPEQYSRGRITAKTLSSHLPAMEESTLILVCGPDGLISGVVKPGLESLGWNLDEQLVVF